MDPRNNNWHERQRPDKYGMGGQRATKEKDKALGTGRCVNTVTLNINKTLFRLCPTTFY